MAERARIFETPPIPEGEKILPKEKRIDDDKKDVPKEAQTAKLYTFKRPATEAEESAPEKGESAFVAYQKKFGGYPAKETYMTNARVYADVAKIKLSDDVLRLYAVLRDYHNMPDVPDKLAAMSDPELLAEVLRMKGEDAMLKQLTTALPHIFGKKN